MVSTPELRRLPAVNRLVEQAAAYVPAGTGHDVLVDAARLVLDRTRAAIRAGSAAPTTAALVTEVVDQVRRIFQPSLQPVINATGVIIHTNLGRAPLSGPARQALDMLASGYTLSLIHI